jgi:hypothetical protein
MKALKSTIGTTHPLLTSEELSTIFYKIPELYSIHWSFLEGMKKLSNSNDSKDHQISSIGDLFKVLASRLGAYSAFLKNYSKALETIHKCSATNNQFSEITRVLISFIFIRFKIKTNNFIFFFSLLLFIVNKNSFSKRTVNYFRRYLNFLN